MAKRSAGRRRGFPEDVTTPLSPTRFNNRGGAALPALAESWQLPAAVAFIHWLLIQIPAAFAWKYGTQTAPSHPQNHPFQPIDGWVGTLINPMQLWDGLWYRLIADEGYGGWTAKAAFWPLFPWSMRGTHKLLGISYEAAGYLIANISFMVALVLLYRLLTIDFDKRVAIASLWAIALFPTALFFSAVYTESLFLALAVGTLFAARLQRWWLAGLIGILAALTRSYGMFLVLPLAVLFWQQYGGAVRRQPARILAVGLPVLGPLFFSWRLHESGAAWLEWKDTQTDWNRYSAMPWETLRWAFMEHSPRNASLGFREGDGANWDWLHRLIDNPSWGLITDKAWRLSVANSDTLELVCTLLFITLALIGLKVLPLYQTVYLLPGLVVPLFQPSSVHTLMSMPRFGLTLFPLFAVIGYLVANRRIAPFLAVGSSVLLVLLTVQFSQWYWVS